MIGRPEAKWLRTVLAALALALLGAAILLALPDGAGTAEASTKTERKCAEDGAVADAANNPGLVSDCAALLDSKKKLEGKDGRKLNWSSSLPMSRWDGITLGGSPHRVTRVLLDGRRGKLNGRIPKQLGNLSELEYLILYYHGLSGKIPKRLGNLSNLRHFSLHSNKLTGSIPPQLGKLSNLEGMDLGGNRLTGKIPKSLGKLSKLHTLFLWHNELTGEIPKQLGNLSNLEKLLLRNNQLTGSIPTELGELPNLKNAEVYLNHLTGCVPAPLKDIEYFGHTVMYKAHSDGLSHEEVRGKYLKGEIPNPYYHLSWCS